MYANCRGIKGKKESFNEIVEKINPDIIILNETMYTHNQETDIKAYKSYTRNREDKGGGGIEILVRKTIENRTIKISEGTPQIEELTIRTEAKKRIIVLLSLLYYCRICLPTGDMATTYTGSPFALIMPIFSLITQAIC